MPQTDTQRITIKVDRDELQKLIAERKVCYFILETQKDERGFIPLIAVQNVCGFYHTDWRWGHDLAKAEEIAKEKNLALGLTDVEAWKIQASTM